MAGGVGGRADDLGEELFGARVAVQHAVLAAFFVVEDELQGHARAAGPLGVGRVLAVTDEIARIVIVDHGFLRSRRLHTTPVGQWNESFQIHDITDGCCSRKRAAPAARKTLGSRFCGNATGAWAMS